ncbi:hypothetical protein BDZ45DRAFT_795270 [Acephala macrosclerotiorum]|nr:hypothetical protein BDZ45DRAFT_795270 [Acephala macrosclerotiorum]
MESAMDIERDAPLADIAPDFDQEAAKLKTTLKIEGFQHLARVIMYKGFLQDIEASNGLTSDMRNIVEYAWSKLVQETHAKWGSMYVSEEAKKVQLDRALNQIKEDKIEQFWADKELNGNGQSANAEPQQARGPMDWFRSSNPDAPKRKAGSKAFKNARTEKRKQEKMLRKLKKSQEKALGKLSKGKKLGEMKPESSKATAALESMVSLQLRPKNPDHMS